MAHSDLDPSGTEGPHAVRDGHLRVRVAGGVVRVPVGTILEVVEGVDLTPLPGAPAAILGIANHRGSPVTVVDLARALDRGAIAGEPWWLIVTKWETHVVGIAVDEVLTLGGKAEEEEPPPAVDLNDLYRSIF